MERIDGLRLRKFAMPEVIFGEGALGMAGHYVRNFKARKVLVVSDPGVMDAGWTREVLQSLEEEGIPVELYTRVTPNPKASEVMEGADVYMRTGCDVTVVVGGGSPIDCAKGIGVVAANRAHVLSFEGVDRIDVPGPPMICIPTTAGSSADVSQFAIITDEARSVKAAIVSKLLVPDVSLIDPRTTTTLSEDLAACTGLDALTHAVEAYVSNTHSPLTDLHALEAIRLVRHNLVEAVRHPQDLHRKTQMMLASLHAGLAFSNASLGAAHAMAHSLGGLHDLAHGECNAHLLEHVAAYNYPSCPERFHRIAAVLGPDVAAIPEQERARLVPALVRDLREAVGVRGSFGSRGVRSEDVPQLARNALADACMATNPREPTQREIEEIYEKVL